MIPLQKFRGVSMQGICPHIRKASALIVTLFFATAVHARIAVTETEDEGQVCWKISTSTATYFYHKEGAGFSSLLDKHGNDWIDYHPWGGSEGLHRGIPNMVFGEKGNFFHPGHSGEKGSVSKINVSEDKVVIHSLSTDRAWEVEWSIYPTHATMRVIKSAGFYWFLYEGTPGGGYDTEDDWYLLSDGTRRMVSEDTIGDIPDPEWIVFGEDDLDTVLFIAHHQDDSISDTYMHWWNMTVFGFGRAGREDYTPKMSAADQHFSIGFLRNANHATLASEIGAIVEFAQSGGKQATKPANRITDVDRDKKKQ